jgi:hypothetical protein
MFISFEIIANNLIQVAISFNNVSENLEEVAL